MKSTKKLTDFWERDESLTILLAAVVFLVFFVSPLSDLGWLARSFLAVGATLVLASGLLVISRRKSHMLLATVLATLAFASDTTAQFTSHLAFPIIRNVCFLGFLCLLNTVILSRVLRDGPV